MDRKKKSQKQDEISKKPIGKSHDHKPNDEKNERKAFNRDDKIDEEETGRQNENRIEIDDDPDGTQRKIPRMKH